MIVFIACVIVAICVGLYRAKRANKSDWKFFGAMGGFTVGLLVGALVIATFVGISDFKDIENRSKVTSLRSEFSESGKFILGTGSIEGSTYYAFYTPKGEGVTLKSISAEGVVVIEENRDDGLYVTYECQETDDFPFILFGLQEWCFGTKDPRLYVPEGTIFVEFEI